MDQLDNQNNPIQLFYCSPVLISRPWRGEPNSTNDGNKLKAPPKAAQLNNQSSIITNQWKGEPNFKSNAPTKHAKDTNFTQISQSLLQLSIRQMPAFTQKCKKIRNFCKYLKTTHLTLYTTKTYIRFFLPKAVLPQNTLHERNLPTVFRGGKKCKTNPISHTLIYPFTHSPKNAKRTQFLIHASTHPLIHPNMQNEPNSTTRIENRELFKTKLISHPRIHPFTHSLNSAKRTQYHPQRRSEAKIRRRRTHPLIYSFTHPPNYAKQTQFTNECL